MKNVANWLQLFAEDEPAEEAQEPEAKMYTEAEMNAEVDKIVARKLAEADKKSKKEIENARTEAERLARMDAEERQKYEQEQTQKELEETRARIAELESERTRSEMLNTARGMLAQKNILASDDLVNVLVSDDAEKTADAVNAFAEMYQEAVKQGVKDSLKGETPKVGSKAGRMTKEDIMKVTNSAERQQLIKENMDLFT